MASCCTVYFTTKVWFLLVLIRHDSRRGVQDWYHPNGTNHWWGGGPIGREWVRAVLSIPQKTEESCKFQSSNSAEPLSGHLWWTELPSVLGHEQADSPLIVQGGSKSFSSPCIKCTGWTRVQPWRSDNATPSLTTEWQSTVKFNFLQMQCTVSGYSMSQQKVKQVWRMPCSGILKPLFE